MSDINPITSYNEEDDAYEVETEDDVYVVFGKDLKDNEQN